MTAKQKINTSYPVTDRNNKLLDFFKYHNFNNVLMIGDVNQPKLILDDMKVVCGFVKNNIYNFTNKQFGGDVIYQVNLDKKEVENTEFIHKIVYSADRKKVYRLSTDDNLFYIKTENLIPYFSNVDARYFFNIDKAESIKKFLLVKHKIRTNIV